MSEENKVVLDENGDIEINDELLNEISGGSNPEDSDDEDEIRINIVCIKF
ncbi:hypothetical protein QE250_13880 [Chromatiaceae bacterium AAb-1]|nr:hypothetical protein [Chromatiaceae bacterium AAb-1]